jgi:hypothetical protein
MTAPVSSETYHFALKQSILDLVQLQRTYDPSDEVLWAFFNARVLLNQPVSVDDFVRETYVLGHAYGELAAARVE